MKKSLYSLFAVLAIFCACQDENSQLGKSLVESSFYNVYADTCSVDISTILLDSLAQTKPILSTPSYCE